MTWKLQNRPPTLVKKDHIERVKGQSHDQLESKPFLHPSLQEGGRGTEWGWDKNSGILQDSEICSRNTSPYCIGLWWLTRLDTRESWSTLGGQGSCHLWNTSKLCQSCWGTAQRRWFERFTCNRKCTRGTGVGEGSLWRRKGRSTTLSQPSLSPTGQVLAGASSKTLHVPHWPLSPTAVLPCTPSTQPAPPTSSHHCWWVGRGRPTHNESYRSTSWQAKGTQRIAVGISHCWQTNRKAAPPTAHQQQLHISCKREPGTGEQRVLTFWDNRMPISWSHYF